MIWSKLKRSIEVLLADPIKEHLRLYLTRYGPGIRAWAMFDRRLGKRRLLAIGHQPIEHPLMCDWYRRRCEAEGMPIPEAILLEH